MHCLATISLVRQDYKELHVYHISGAQDPGTINKQPLNMY